jgi:AcrR family transcriptional regulator
VQLSRATAHAAYEPFSPDGIRAAGVDAVIARADTTKMTLYRIPPPKAT